MRNSRGGARVAGEEGAPELVPGLFDAGAERPPTSGQFSAAMLVGLVLLAVELLAAPLVFGVTLVVSLITWWLLDAPWAGRRRARRRGITSRLLYLSTLMLLGLWLGVMFIFRASDPALSSGFTTTLPVFIWGVDVSLLGWRGILATTAWDWGIMLAAGVLNAVAFFALSKALRLVTVVHVNLVNASQVAMAAVAGVAFFDEAWTAALSIGVGLTVLGLLVMRKR